VAPAAPARRRPVAPAAVLRLTYRIAKRLVILALGLSVVAVGIAMLVLPGPAVVVIPAGIAILATEFAWARHLLQQMKAQASRAHRAVFNNNGQRRS